jgi:hypothetical protein
MIIAVVLLSGCGDPQLAGVGSGGTGVVTVAKASYTATLEASPVGGYLINAVVFLDKNGNYHADADEPYAITGVDGTALIEAPATDLARYPVVVAALKGVAIDSATLQPLPATYILSAPAGGSAVITPISTQVQELVAAGRYSTVQQAVDSLAAGMGLAADTNLLDVGTNSNPAVTAAAKSIAALLWMQSSAIVAADPATGIMVDTARYRLMMQIIADNMLIVSRLNSPQNLLNLNSNISTVLEAIPRKTIVY